MIGNVHGDNGKTPSPSGSQHIMLHVMYSFRALPRTFGKMTFLKNWKKNISRSLLNELATHAPNTVWRLVMWVPWWLLGAKPEKLQQS